MSLQTLLEAAQFLEQKIGDEKKLESTPIKSVGLNDSSKQCRTSKPSNLDDTIASIKRVNELTFKRKEQSQGIIIPPSQHNVGPTSTIFVQEKAHIGQCPYRSDKTIIHHPYMPVKETSKPASINVLHVKNPLEIPHKNFVSHLPSLETNKEIQPTLSTSQIKSVKHSVTLTHNQLEKNRRAHLKECFEALKASIPRLEMRRSSNLTILKAALKHIQVLKRKNAIHQHTLVELLRERDEKINRAETLMCELLKTTNRNKIEEFVAEVTRKIVALSPPTSCLNSSQLSTSTASEAEEEAERQDNANLNEIFFRPLNTIVSSAFAGPPVYCNQSALVSIPSNTKSKIVHSSSNYLSRDVSSQNEMIKHIQESLLVGTNGILKRDASNAPLSSQGLSCLSSSKSADAVNFIGVEPRRSVACAYSESTRRSATPTPSSDFVQFFPCFSVGSGGSPPLLSTTQFDFTTNKVVSPEKQYQASQLDHFSKTFAGCSANAVLNLLNFNANIASSESVGLQAVPAYPAAVRFQQTANQFRNLNMLSAQSAKFSQHENCYTMAVVTETNSTSASLSNTIVVTSFAGYEVKVKYLNSSVLSVPSVKAYQACEPTGKQPFFSESFATQTVNALKLQPLTTPQASTAEADFQKTSFYQGATATNVNSVSNCNLRLASHQSDGEYPHFRQNISDERVTMLNEQALKVPVKIKAKASENNLKRKISDQQYELSNTKPVQLRTESIQNDAKRKVTFNLWDRKYHAS